MTVQRRTAVVPAGMPVTVVVGDVGVVMVAVPLIKVHNPVPGAGLFPAIVNDPRLQKVWLGPALAVQSLIIWAETTGAMKLNRNTVRKICVTLAHRVRHLSMTRLNRVDVLIIVVCFDFEILLSILDRMVSTKDWM